MAHKIIVLFMKKRYNVNINPHYILLFGLFVLVVLILFYLFVFGSGFSLNSNDWRNFGNYLSGVANVVNILVFISISILISNINNNNKVHELKFLQKKEIFSRFLNSYEKFLNELFELKILIAKVSVSESKINDDDEKKILEYYISIKTLDTLLKSYLPVNDIDVELKSFLDKYSILIGSLESKKDKEIIKTNIRELISEIELLISSFSKKINTYLNKEI